MYEKTILNKDVVINEYRKNFPNEYEELSEFKIIMLLLEEFPNIEISKNFPKYLILDNFDLMLEIFGYWHYEKMSDKDIEKLSNVIEKAFDYNIDKYNINNIFFAISNYAPQDILDQFTAKLKTKSQLLWNEYCNS